MSTRGLGISILFMASALVAPGGASAAVLFDQTIGTEPPAQNFSSTDFDATNDFDTQAADDFTVPAAQTWRIISVDVFGKTTPVMNHGGRVFVYSDAGGVPGALLFSALDLALPSPSPAQITAPISGAAPLPPGTYWLSFQTRTAGASQWSWDGLAPPVRGYHFADKTGPGIPSGPCINNFRPASECFAGLGATDLKFSLSGDDLGKFTIGKLRRKRNGTVKVPVTVPAAGEIRISTHSVGPQGPKAKAAAIPPVFKAKTAGLDAGTTTLTVRTNKRGKKQLRLTGKVSQRADITFTPTGGAPNTLTKKLVFKKKR